MGALLLALGTGGLFTVKLSNPRLKGLGWLGAAFASGLAGALLLFCEGEGKGSGRLVGAGSDLALLLAVVLLHVSTLELMDAPSLIPVFGLVLLYMDAGTAALASLGYSFPGLRAGLLSLLVAAQLLQTAGLLSRNIRSGVRASTSFSIGVLVCFATTNVLRGVVVLDPWLARPKLLEELNLAAFVLYLAFALGIAFAFFWVTTAQLSSELEHMASTDPLTRLYNRRVFRDWCDRELSRSLRLSSAFSILMLDLDHFKQINDSFGHSGGDLAICAVVEEMQDSVRGIDVLGRWGGEEFVVLLPGAVQSDALVVAQRIRRNVERIDLARSYPEQFGHAPEVHLTVSLGLASYRGEADSIEQMLDRADAALYQAKRQGRNRVHTCQPQPQDYSARC